MELTTEPLISVIIPVYNVRSYLREALDSVIHQTYHNLEILVIDDGSTDGSEAICDEYQADSRIRVIHQENRGLSGARNTGLDQMTGDYVSFLDPDDAFHPEMIETLLNVLLQNNADAAVCGYINFETEGLLSEARQGYNRGFQKEVLLTEREAIIMVLEGNFPFSVCNRLYRKEVWGQLRFPEGHVYEDLWMISSILEKCSRIATIFQCLYFCRKRSGSITQTNTAQNIQDYLTANRILLDYAEKMRSIIPSDIIHIRRETMLRDMIFKRAEVAKAKTGRESTDVMNMLETEIQKLAEEEKPTSLKTKTVWWLYRHCPSMLLPFRACYQFISGNKRQKKMYVYQSH